MFKIGSFEEEIIQSMEKNLSSNNTEDKRYSSIRLSKAADYLNSAAKFFKQAGMHSEAEEIIKIMNGLK